MNGALPGQLARRKTTVVELCWRVDGEVDQAAW